MRVLLNAGNLTAGGPRLVLENLLPAIVRQGRDFSFVALVPWFCRNATWLHHRNLRICFTQRGVPHLARRLHEVLYQIPRLRAVTGADVCLTLGDLGPVTLDVPHVVMLHNAYLTCNDDKFTRIFSLSERARIRYLRWHFRRMASQCSRIIVQTPVMAESMHRTYGVGQERIVVMPSAMTVAAQALLNGRVVPDPQVASVRQRLKLLFLSATYPHKNHRVLPGLMAELKRRGRIEAVHLFLTCDPGRTRRLLGCLAPYRDYVTNLGVLEHQRVPSVLAAADGLFLPSLMESFGFIYLEAMAARLPILTSDLAFARWMCGELADYFDPTDPRSIADAIERLVEDGKPPDYEQRCISRLREFPEDWDEIARGYLKVLEDCVS